jgi:hypothetical protein
MMSNDLSLIGWQPLVLGDGRTLHPLGLRDMGVQPVWCWGEHSEGLGVGITPDSRAGVIYHALRDPTDDEVDMVLAALGIDSARVSPGPPISRPFLRTLAIAP